MVDQSLFMPLSPPSSPRMSKYHGTAIDPNWQQTHSTDIENTSSEPESNMALVDSSMPMLALDMQRHPMLRSHKTFPHSLRTSGIVISKPHTPDSGSGPSPNAQGDHGELSNMVHVPTTELPTVSFGGSAPASPVSNLTPPSDKQDRREESQDLNGLDIGADSMDEDENDETGRPLTAAELRAQKRKMKRFRSARFTSHLGRLC
jgi:hypothetical protein